jgi:uncharacterized protein YecT (DUF1311 family)
MPLRLRDALALACVLAAALPELGQCGDAAASASYSAEHTACMQRADGVNADMHACIASESKAQDTRLNAAYRELRASLPVPRQAALQAAQRDWLRFRDSNCSYVNDPQGGSNARLGAGLCVLRMTTERADELRSLQAPR